MVAKTTVSVMRSKSLEILQIHKEVSDLFPYPQNPLCMFEKLPHTLSFQKGNHEDGPEPYFLHEEQCNEVQKPICS